MRGEEKNPQKKKKKNNSFFLNWEISATGNSVLAIGNILLLCKFAKKCSYGVQSIMNGFKLKKPS